MNVLTFNLTWMSWNIFLAVIGMIFGLMLKRHTLKRVKVIWALLWLIFIPNSIYLVTDLYHLTYQLGRVHYYLSPLLVLEYMVLLISGIVTYTIGLFSLEKELQNFGWKKNYIKLFIIVFNFFISFGVTLGRFQRTNSWDVFTYPRGVISDILSTLYSIEQMVFVVLFGIFCNILYFGFRKNLLFTFHYDKDSSHHNSHRKKGKQILTHPKKRD